MKKLLSRLFVLHLFLCIGVQAFAQTDSKVIQIALSGAFISESGVGIYEKIAGYVTSKSGVKLEIVTGLAYDTINKMLVDGALGGGFVCGLPYVLLNEKSKTVDLLVAPVMKAARYGDKPVYYSDLIVHRDSPYKSIEELKGMHFAFNDQLSNSGYNLPRFFFLEKNLEKSFFGKITRTGSHEESIRAVANKEVDYSFVDSLVLDYELYEKQKSAQQVRVIHSLGPSAVPPLVVAKSLDKEIAKKIKHALLNMHKDFEGRKILDSGLVERFDPVTDMDYSSIRRKYEYAKTNKAIEIGK